MAEIKKKGLRLTGMVARILMFLAAGLLLMSYASMIVNPAKAWYMNAIGLLFIPIAVLNLFLLVWAIRRKSGALMIPLIALLPSAFLIGKYIQFSSGADSGGKPVKIVSYNVGRFIMGRKPEFKETGGHKACMDSVVNFIKAKAKMSAAQDDFSQRVGPLTESLTGIVKLPKEFDEKEFMSNVLSEKHGLVK